MRSEKVTFKNALGDTLSGRIDFPFVGQPKAFALFAHCFTCSKNLKAVDAICQELTRHDIAVLRFDFTGLGQSKGAFEETTFSTNIKDLKEAYEFLRKAYQPPQILIGHSLGGAAVLYASAEMPHVNSIVTIGSPASPVHVKKLLKEDEETIKKTGEAEVNIGGRPFRIKKQFLDDLEGRKSEDVIGRLDKALLIMHSPQDQVVGIDNAAEIYGDAMHPKSFITLDGSDHLMSNTKDAEYVGQIIGPWASRYIDEISNEIAPEGEVWTSIGEEGFYTEITAGRHHQVADEPAGSGGKDLGPSPYGYLLSALGSCTAMTLRMYADHKKWKLEGVRVKLTHDKIHNKDGEAVENAKGKIDQIKRMVQLKGELTEEERKRLIEIADRCPVHKTLEGKPQIITEEDTD